MSTFGKKTRAEWTGADNATHAMSVMLGAELREKAAKASDKARMAWVIGITIVVSLPVGIFLAAL